MTLWLVIALWPAWGIPILAGVSVWIHRRLGPEPKRETSP